MKQSDDRRRIIIAVTATTEVTKLWSAAMRSVGHSGADLLALYLADNHWQRAASLPFTREVSRIGGIADFTVQRANQLSKEAEIRTERIVKKLAEDSGLALAFKVMSDYDTTVTAELTAGQSTVLIAPSFLVRLPIFSQFERLDWQIELVEATEEAHESE